MLSTAARNPRVVLAGMVLVTGLLMSSRASAQADGSIIGLITDESGATLPGVTITATSPVLQTRNVVAVTNEHGEYRLSPLPIGVYSLDYTLAGFQSVRREQLRLTVGFQAKVDIVLKIGGLEESITVSGASPVVDVTSTTTRTELTREVLDLIPTGRNGLTALLTQTPGVRSNLDVGGSSFVAVPAFHAYGQDSESWQTLEGVLTSSPKGTQSGNQWDYSVLEEARVQSSGADIDVPSRGVALTAILKSGGNDFHGTGWFGGTRSNLQSNNLDDELRSKGLTSGDKMENRWDASGDVGGRLVRDKLWFYLGLRKRQSIDDYAGAFKLDGSPATHLQMLEYDTQKLSYQMSQSNKLVGFYQWTAKHEINGASVLTPYESSTDNQYRQHIYKVEWQAVKGSSLVTSLQYGRWRWGSIYTGLTDSVAFRDTVSLQTGGQSLTAANQPIERRGHLTGRVTWYKADAFRGNHEVKAGFDSIDSFISRAWVSRPYNYQLVFQAGVPFQVVTLNYPVKPATSSQYLGFWVKDNWVIGRRFTASLGVRFSHDVGFVDRQCRQDAVPREFAPAACWDKIDFNTWNSWAPRATFAYDIGNNGKTVVKWGWSRFDHMRQIDEMQPANKNIATNTTWRWRDLNNNRDYDAGEVNLDVNGPDYVSAAVRDSGVFSNGVMNPNEKEPKVDQFDLSLEREIARNLAVRVTGLYSRNFNNYRALNTKRAYSDYNIVITEPDPGPDARVGTADDPGQTITYYDYPVALKGAAFQVPTLFNPDGNIQSFKTLEFAGSRRLSNRWQFQASYSATKIHIPYPSLADYNPNAEINTSNDTWEWGGKVSGTYIFPLDVTTSVFYNHVSGNPQARTVLVTGAKQSGNLTLNVEPLGSLRLPSTNTVDLRLEKSFRMAKTDKLTVRASIYNTLNANTVTARILQSGSRYLNPTAFMPPRFVELGASYSF
jgi:hypothetical protein